MPKKLRAPDTDAPALETGAPMLDGSVFWACDCCGTKRPPYSGYIDAPYYPNISGYYGGVLDGCNCCGGEQAVAIFTGATGEPRPTRHDVFNCSACATASFDWATLIGRSITLTRCRFQCEADGVSIESVFHGCATFPIRCYSAERLMNGSDCPDADGSITIQVMATCRRFDTGERCVSLHGIRTNVNRGPGNCGWPQGCSGYNLALCTPDPFTSPSDYENRIGSLTQGETYLVSRSSGCATSVGVSATPGVFQYGITSALVVF